MVTENTARKIRKITELYIQLADDDFTGRIVTTWNEGGICGLEQVEDRSRNLINTEGSISQIRGR